MMRAEFFDRVFASHGNYRDFVGLRSVSETSAVPCAWSPGTSSKWGW